ncbi:uncharacterized protein METZ01_LOCUS488354, partial [marine metagenome]
GPLMTQSVAESADGLLVHPFHTPKYMDEITLPLVEKGLSSAGKKSSDFDFSISIMTVSGLTEESYEKSLQLCKNQIAFYASTPAYKGVLESHDRGDMQPKLNILSKEGKWKEMGELIDDELLNAIAVVAESPKGVAEEIKKRYAGKGDRISPAFYSGELELASEVIKELREEKEL